ncbi:methyltransferase [Leptolyngbya sp. BC1307]|uniref:class I SAM-dependent methyltransferase n=1 Tax=Leptolyngbya sp. BC1307 TaxID=2029589 RepID=UPI000EFD9F39|nr:methyltransferase [Leptolyngbya sp. BC1307]
MPPANDHTPPSPQPFLYATPAEALGELIYQSVTIGSQTFEIAYPGNADQLLDHPSTHRAFEADEYMPYWAELWPSAQMLGEALRTQSMRSDWSNPLLALEIGCGVGLPGIVALSLGMRVIFSDYDATAVEFAARNAMANGFDNFTKLPLDWRVPPPELQVPLILAADVIYEERNIAPLVALIQQVLAPGGICLLSDPDRSTRGGFCYALKQARLKFTRWRAIAAGPNGRQVNGSVYRIQG